MTCEESGKWNDCRHVDSDFQDGDDLPIKGEGVRKGRSAPAGPAGLQAFPSWNELGTSSWGAVEIAFDHENGDIIIETDVAAEICRGAKDIHHEAFWGP